MIGKISRAIIEALKDTIHKESESMEENDIEIGDEVIIQGHYPEIVAIVTHNEEDHFCYMMKDGISYHCIKAYAKPKKTGRHFDVEGFLKTRI